MKKFAEVFRGKENRHAMDVLSDEVMKAINESQATGTCVEVPITVTLGEKYEISYSALPKTTPYKWYLFNKDDKIVATAVGPEDVVAEIFSCAIVSFIGRTK